MRQSWEQSNAPAITTKAEFLAPLILTCPARVERPHISRTAFSSSGEEEDLDSPIEELMDVASQLNNLINVANANFGLDSTRYF